MAAVISKPRKSNKSYVKRETGIVSGYLTTSTQRRPKLIYRNGQTYIYVGNRAAQR